MNRLPHFDWLIFTPLGLGLFLFSCSPSERARRTEVFTFPSGARLENETWLSSGFHESTRHNRITLVDANARRELIGDVWYEGQGTLFSRWPVPIEFTQGKNHVLVIGPYVCARRDAPRGPSWSIQRPFTPGIGLEWAYLRSFADTNIAPSSQGDEFVLDQMDLSNNLLFLKSIPKGESSALPEYLVFSSVPYGAPWKFDVLRTKAKNGPRFYRPMPHHLVLDFSVVTFSVSEPPRANEPRQEREMALSAPNAKEVIRSTRGLLDGDWITLADPLDPAAGMEPTRRIEATYGFSDPHSQRLCILLRYLSSSSPETIFLAPDQWLKVSDSIFQGGLRRLEFVRVRIENPGK